MMESNLDQVSLSATEFGDVFRRIHDGMHPAKCPLLRVFPPPAVPVPVP